MRRPVMGWRKWIYSTRCDKWWCVQVENTSISLNQHVEKWLLVFFNLLNVVLRCFQDIIGFKYGSTLHPAPTIRAGLAIIGLLYLGLAVLVISVAAYFGVKIVLGGDIISPRAAVQRATSLTNLGGF